MRIFLFLSIVIYLSSSLAQDCENVWKSVADIGELADELQKIADKKGRTIIATPKAVKKAIRSVDPILTINQMDTIESENLELIFSDNCDKEVITSLTNNNKKYFESFPGNKSFLLEFGGVHVGAFVQSINAICDVNILTKNDRVSKIWITRPKAKAGKLACKDFAKILAGLGLELITENGNLMLLGPTNIPTDYEKNYIRNKLNDIVFPKELGNFYGYEFKNIETIDLSYVEYWPKQKAGVLGMTIYIGNTPLQETNVLHNEISKELQKFKERLAKKGSNLVGCTDIELISDSGHAGKGFECDYSHYVAGSDKLYEWNKVTLLFEINNRIIRYDVSISKKDKRESWVTANEFVRESIDFIAKENTGKL